MPEINGVLKLMRIGRPPMGAMNAPSIGCIVSKLRPSEASVPSQVWLQKYGGGAMPPESTYLTGGWLGMAYAPLLIGVNQDDHPATPGFRVQAFDTAEGITRLRGKWTSVRLDDGSEVPAMPTFHPAFLLRTPASKRQSWSDLLAIDKRLRELGVR